ncbi:MULTISPECIES: lysis system i-spanin subunit Rz [unclassified Caballeronia]|uniref:lysis system i-spanin subunit Rz n=1 Tax=unclassified Caballeronia TaxID=2646786 RepID=UPI002854A448|nr:MULTISPECIES: lysis system i-spanin subunit Rz [unclassified Caballeronia]MDR5775592.1 lysis system i-spanin subunit Rz [Caballeronia sp. LZ002]MDR5802313.1 lysis system i-spanin subunit Rz [Caballeronia sp. LZ001]MDR5851030.1 lysis system i-spanin subunit Rz [Caballeronia sp. LZ003]
MSSTFGGITLLLVFGVAIGATAMHAFDGPQLVLEQAAHARDNEANAQKLSALSDATEKAASGAIASHNAAAAQIAKLDKRFFKEVASHEADNAKSRAAIADGSRRLRIATANASANHSGAANPSPATGRVGDGARRYAELPPEIGRDLFAIVDDADGNARMKATYLQHYVLMLQRRGLITGGEPSSNAAKEFD